MLLVGRGRLAVELLLGLLGDWRGSWFVAESHLDLDGIICCDLAEVSISFANSTYRLSWTILIVLAVLSLVLVEALRVVAFRVAQRDVRLVLVLLHVQSLVQVVVDHVVLGRLRANVVGRWWHADQVNLMEGEALRADPRVLLVLLAVVEHLTVQTLIGVIARECYKNCFVIIYQ